MKNVIYSLRDYYDLLNHIGISQWPLKHLTVENQIGLLFSN